MDVDSSPSPEAHIPSAPRHTSLDLQEEQSVLDIFHTETVDQSKCIAGRFRMIWDMDPRKKKEKLETLVLVPHRTGSNQADQTFRVVFKLAEESLAQLTIRTHDEFRLSLRGAAVEKTQGIPKLCTLGLTLVFSHVVDIQWSRAGHSLTELKLTSSREQEYSWYDSPKKDGIRASSPRTSMKRRQSEVEISSEGASTENGRKQKKQEKREQRLIQKRQKIADNEHSRRPVETNPPPGETETQGQTHDRSLQGLNSRPPHSLSVPEAYLPISALKRWLGKPSNINIIGIVTDITAPKQTSKGDYQNSLTLVDISNCEGKKLRVNCFAKRFIKCLPAPRVDDCVILRGLKAVMFNELLSCTGYHDRLNWAAFSPEEGRVYNGSPDDVPNQPSCSFIHPYIPIESELTYCVQLSNWWREQNKDLRTSSMAQRVHRLISDATPDQPPNGYFNCTVEILRTYINYSGLATVYVTDYTQNSQVQPCTQQWCPKSMAHFVLQFTMWNTAASTAGTMRPGEYYHIDNAKMKKSGTDHFEAKADEKSRIVKLEEKDAARIATLNALLYRKKEHQAVSEESDIPFHAIEAATRDRYFHGTVQLLHKVVDNGQTAVLYVTDYSQNALLDYAPPDHAWAAGLRGRVLEIHLSGEQRLFDEELTPGSYYCMRKLRIRDSPTKGHPCVRLDGPEKLIKPVSADRTDNPNINGLLRRKEDWERNNSGDAPPLGIADGSELRRHHGCTLIKDISLTQGHQPLFIYAKVVDYYPLRLSEAYYQFCTRCKEEIPLKQRACFSCHDVEHEHVRYLYQLFIMIEDEDRQRIPVSVNDNCWLLEGLKRVDLTQDKITFEQFNARLKPLLGDLPLAHSALAASKSFEIDMPYMKFEVDSWVVSEERCRAYGLRRYYSIC